MPQNSGLSISFSVWAATCTSCHGPRSVLHFTRGPEPYASMSSRSSSGGRSSSADSVSRLNVRLAVRNFSFTSHRSPVRA